MRLIYYLLFSSIVFVSCNQDGKDSGNSQLAPQSEPMITQLSSENEFADCQYFTEDNENNPVLCWVEGKDENAVLMYATYNVANDAFENSITVTPSLGLKPHHESMPKVAFKGDGTVVAVYSHRRRVNRLDAMFEGELYYVQSFDEGISWTEPKYIHSDTTIGYSRSFIDIATLPDGEIGAVWLDGKKRSRKGSTLAFAKTSGDSGFIMDIEIAQQTCQCCRTDIYVDEHGNINVAYRDIFNDSIRDMAHLTSSDFGVTFSERKRISHDNWVINGCPHTGPSMAWANTGLNFFWFSAGGGEGVYHTLTEDHGASFSERELINPHARHPQSVSLSDQKLVLVWDETFKTNTSYLNRVGLRTQDVNDSIEVKYITPDSVDSTYPVVYPISNSSVLVSWTQKLGMESKVFYKRVEL